MRIALGGFGRGHGALAVLRALPVDVLKLDRCFVEGVAEQGRQHAVTRGLLRIAQDLGIRTVAAGVDRPEQVHALRDLGCAQGVGMAFAGPLDERRLRGSLARGVYPVPAAVQGPVPAPVPAGETAREQVGSCGPPPRPRRSHDETPVPPA